MCLFEQRTNLGDSRPPAAGPEVEHGNGGPTDCSLCPTDVHRRMHCRGNLLCNRRTLTPVYQTLSFEITTFEPFVSGIVQQLLSLVSELDTLGGKRRVIACLLAVIERSGARVRSYEFSIYDEAS